MVPFIDFINSEERTDSLWWGLRESILTPRAIKPSPFPQDIPAECNYVLEEVKRQYQYYQIGFYFGKAIIVFGGLIAIKYGLVLL